MSRQESRMAEPDTVALCIPHGAAAGPPIAFIDDHEFCHIHALSKDGGIHLTLPPALARRAVALRWAEPHLVARAGLMPETHVLVYLPRNDAEIEIVWGLILASFRFALRTLEP